MKSVPSWRKKIYMRDPLRAGFPPDRMWDELSEGCLWQHCSPVLLHKQLWANVPTRESSPCKFMIGVTRLQPWGEDGIWADPQPLEHTIIHVLTGFRHKIPGAWWTWYKLCSLHTGGFHTWVIQRYPWTTHKTNHDITIKSTQASYQLYFCITF